MELFRKPTGRIFMFDGPDGVGKTEMIKLIAADMEKLGRKVYTTRVNGGTNIGEKLREVLLSDTARTAYADLFIVKAMHCELAHELRQKKEQGIICLVDRSPVAMWAYQVRAGSLPQDYALPVIKDSLQMFAPDAVFVYIASLHTLKGRLSQRQGDDSDYFASKPDEYQGQTIRGYVESEKFFGSTVIDASGTLEEVHHRTMLLLAPLVEPIT